MYNTKILRKIINLYKTSGKILPDVSVIIPVYNAEKNIQKCLDSLLAQTLKNIEIICVNDGSTDKTLTILEKYAKKDNRLLILNQKNQGTGIARNLGLKKSRGKYLSFMDADDYAEPEMLERMLNAIIKNDVDFAYCAWNFITIDTNNPKIVKKEIKCINKFSLNNDNRIKINVELWNKLFKKELVKKYKINFPSQKLGDDASFTKQYLIIAQNSYGINDALYNYIRNSTGIISKLPANPQYIYDSVQTQFHTLNFINKLPKAMKENGLEFLVLGIEKTLNFWINNINKDSYNTLLSKTSNILTKIPDNYIKCKKMLKIKNRDFTDYIEYNN